MQTDLYKVDKRGTFHTVDNRKDSLSKDKICSLAQIEKFES